MIKIIRSPEPDIYKIGKIKKAQDALMAQYDKSERQERFKFDTPLLRELRDPLKEMCGGKCCYCESKISVSSYGEIENYRPKGGARGLQKEYAPLHYFWLAYDWNNLFISCQTCNQKFKRDLFPLEDESKRAKVLAVGKDLVKENPLLLQPCLDDPEDHLEFHSNGTVKPHSKRGKATIDILGLNRDALVQQRRKEADGFLTKLQLFTRTAGKDKDMRPVILDYVRELHSDHPSQEYVAVQRAVFEKWYEKNKPLWERIKKTVKDKSKTKTSEKKRACICC